MQDRQNYIKDGAFMAELLTSLDVVNQSFKKSMRGYDANEVDEFLDHVSESLQVYAQKTSDTERKLAEKEASLAEYEKMKDVLHEALIMAQKSADDKVKNAQAQADKMIADARKKADDICREAMKENEGLCKDIQRIKDIRTRYEQEVRAMLGRFDSLLTQCVNGSPLNGAVEEVLSGLNDDTEPTEETKQPVSRPDLEAAYSMLGLSPKDILKTKQKPE